MTKASSSSPHKNDDGLMQGGDGGQAEGRPM